MKRRRKGVYRVSEGFSWMGGSVTGWIYRFSFSVMYKRGYAYLVAFSFVFGVCCKRSFRR